MRINRNGKQHSWCKPCVQEQTLERQRALKLQAVEYKGGQCVDCNVTGHPCIYDFHHLDPNEKDFSLGQLKITKWSKVITDELDKCVLLCSNCHRRRHTKY